MSTPAQKPRFSARITITAHVTALAQRGNFGSQAVPACGVQGVDGGAVNDQFRHAVVVDMGVKLLLAHRGLGVKIRSRKRGGQLLVALACLGNDAVDDVLAGVELANQGGHLTG